MSQIPPKVRKDLERTASYLLAGGSAKAAGTPASESTLRADIVRALWDAREQGRAEAWPEARERVLREHAAIAAGLRQRLDHALAAAETELKQWLAARGEKSEGP